MSEFHNLPNAISHKQLNNLFNKAKKEIKDLKTQENIPELTAEKIEFNSLLDDWADISKQVLDQLDDQNPVIFDHLHSKQIMALGAIQTHLTMAIQAKKFIEKN